MLDHGYVRLIDHMGDDLSIVRSARVSFDADWRAGDNHGSDERLIRYLWKNSHTSPFESVTFTFEVQAPIFVFRQWHRHRMQSYNELSARYTELPELFYVPEPDIVGTQSKSNKQGRSLDLEDEHHRAYQCAEYQHVCEWAFEIYRDLLLNGWPRELARAVLPLSTYSRMFVTMNLLNLFRFLTLRMHEHAQFEIRQYAKALLELIRPIVPVAVQAWEAPAK